MIDMIQVKSSNVDKVGFDVEKGELHVLFKHAKYMYIYTKVPESMHSKLMAADSPGGYLHEFFVKSKWEFRKERL